MDEPLVSASYCHCTRCQRRTGAAASANGRVAPGAFRIVAGEEHVHVWAPDGGFAKSFCELCGSALFSRDPANPDTVGIRLGSLDADPGIRPQWRQFVANVAAWEPIPDDGLPRHPAGRTL
ncbi:MAG TPA: GFA family protein [Gaiellaceae bacterium]|nr:GFA family protein [Gaiellaceae bacterium]